MMTGRQYTGKMAACAAGLMLAACAAAPVGEAPLVGAAPTPLRAAINPNDILGKPPAAVDRLLGPPALTRREGPGEFRRYSLGECALLVIIYPNDRGEPRVAHLDAAAKSSSAAKPSVEECLAKR